MVSYSDSSVQKKPQRIKIWKTSKSVLKFGRVQERESFFFRFRWQNATYLKLSSCFYHRFKEKRSQKDPMLTNGMQKLEIKRKKNSVCSKKSPADDKDSKSLHLDLNHSHIKHNFVNIKTIKRCKHKKIHNQKLSNCISCTEWGKLYLSCVPFVESIGTRTSALHLECGPLFYDK